MFPTSSFFNIIFPSQLLHELIVLFDYLSLNSSYCSVAPSNFSVLRMSHITRIKLIILTQRKYEFWFYFREFFWLKSDFSRNYFFLELKQIHRILANRLILTWSLFRHENQKWVIGNLHEPSWRNQITTLQSHVITFFIITWYNSHGITFKWSRDRSCIISF